MTPAVRAYPALPTCSASTRSPTALAAFLALCAAASAQTTTKVLPTSAAGVDGNDLSYYPLGLDSGRLQQVSDGSAVTTSVAVISGFALRADGAAPNVVRQYPGRSISRLEVQVGYGGVAPAAMSTFFAPNRAGALTTVFAGSYNLPTLQFAGAAPFNLAVPFVQPFVYIRTQGNLLTEIVLPGTAQNRYPWAVDGHSGGGGGASNRFGTAGGFAGGDLYRFDGADTYLLHPGGRVTLGVGDLNQQYPSAAVFGLSRSMYNGLSLPFDMTLLGAPRQALQVSLDVVLPLPLRLSKGKWHGTAFLPVPNVTIPAGTRLFGQGVFTDAASSALGLVFSNGVELRLDSQAGTPFPALGSVSSTSADGVFFSFPGIGGPVIQLQAHGFH